MTTITVLAAIDYSEKQRGVCFLDLDMATGTGSERWEPASSYEQERVRRTYGARWMETLYGVAFFDTEAQLNAAMEEAKKRTELERLVSLECSASKKAWRTGTLQHKAEWRVIRQRLEALQAELEPAGVETVEAA